MPERASDAAVTCLLCGSPAARYCALDGGSYRRCGTCGALFLHPMPTPEEMRAYAERHYREGVYAEYARARPLKLATFRRRLALIRPHAPGGRLLDVGAACGFMLEAALEAGYDPAGVEFSVEAIRLAAPEVRGRIVHGDMGDLPPGTFDVITAFDILEHAREPLRTLRAWAERLRPGGVLALTTPDTDSLLRKVMGARWPMLQPLQHTVLFSRAAMPRFLREAGLEVLELRGAAKVMTPAYLVGQLEPYFPRAARLGLRVGAAVKPVAERAILFHIGEFIVVARKAPA
jgi:2-polyprenyl-3-methyl-5-hydroxy-6-metoxy-1,4-benzoquinol methylase